MLKLPNIRAGKEIKESNVIFEIESNSACITPWVDPWGTYRNREGMVQFWFWYFFFFSPWGRELSFGIDLSRPGEHRRPLLPFAR